MEQLRITSHTDIETLADEFIEDVLSTENFGSSRAKDSFLTGGNILICEFKGLQEYLQKSCVDKHGIWTALPFKPLTGLLMRCAYTLSPRVSQGGSQKERRKDEKDNIYDSGNMVWAIYNLLEGREKTFSFAGEIASLFIAYQIYRPQLIEAWNRGEAYKISKIDENFVKNEKWQRELWTKLKTEYKNELSIYDFYKLMESELNNPQSDKSALPQRIFIFAPLAIAPIHLKTLMLLANAGCKVNLYLHFISGKYTGDTKSDKSIANLRKKSWLENEKIVNENELYWDLGNRLVANFGRSAQVLYEQIGWENLEAVDEERKTETLLEKIQANILNDENQKEICKKDDSITINNCFSPLREIEVLCDYVLDLFIKKSLSPADIAVVSPNIENYASAIEIVFGRYEIPFRIADRDVKKYDKTTQLLSLLFSQIGGRYEAADIVSLFEYSMFVREKELDSNLIERLKKWVRENAIRHGLKSDEALPNYSFESGFDQLAAGFFMISETEFSEESEYCYPDIEGSSARALGDFVQFIRTLEKIDSESKKENTVEEWDSFLRENLQEIFGADETDFNEERDNPYQKVIGAWDSLKREMLIGFGSGNSTIGFPVLKNALLQKMDTSVTSSYAMSGVLSFSNFETIRAVPHKVICCIGMNSGDFPGRTYSKEISIISAEYQHGDKDPANEERLMFLEMLGSAKEALYISFIGQSDKNADELDPSSAVVLFLKNLKEQYGIEDIVVKHPLQPFSKKYYNGDLSTYDKRWDNLHEAQKVKHKKNIWEWEVDTVSAEERGDIDSLYYVLADAPKYFIRNVCNIELPQDVEFLENIEPFIVNKGLESWSLENLILNEREQREIVIKQLRGELPSGNFADKIIERSKEEVENLKKHTRKETPDTFWIYLSKDQGKYRLKHWLYHLDFNLKVKEFQDTKLFLKGSDAVKVTLPGLSAAQAEIYLNNLWLIKEELDKKLCPVFPNAAWEYMFNISNKYGNISQEQRLSNAWEEMDNYSKYTGMAIGEAESFENLGIESEFINYSKRLFDGYNGKAEELTNE